MVISNTYLPDNIGGLQLANGENVLGNGSIKVTLTARHNKTQ